MLLYVEGGEGGRVRQRFAIKVLVAVEPQNESGQTDCKHKARSDPSTSLVVTDLSICEIIT